MNSKLEGAPWIREQHTIDFKIKSPQSQNGEGITFEKLVKIKEKISIFVDYFLIILSCSIGILPIIDSKTYPGNPMEYFVWGITIAIIWYFIAVRYNKSTHRDLGEKIYTINPKEKRNIINPSVIYMIMIGSLSIILAITYYFVPGSASYPQTLFHICLLGMIIVLIIKVEIMHDPIRYKIFKNGFTYPRGLIRYEMISRANKLIDRNGHMAIGMVLSNNKKYFFHFKNLSNEFINTLMKILDEKKRLGNTIQMKYFSEYR